MNGNWFFRILVVSAVKNVCGLYNNNNNNNAENDSLSLGLDLTSINENIRKTLANCQRFVFYFYRLLLISYVLFHYYTIFTLVKSRQAWLTIALLNLMPNVCSDVHLISVLLKMLDRGTSCTMLILFSISTISIQDQVQDKHVKLYVGLLFYHHYYDYSTH